jgi:hypothetical protein
MAYFGSGKPQYRLIGTDEDPIPPDEPVFLIRAQDELAVTAVRIYAVLARQRGLLKVADSAREIAELMEVWPTRKRPD